MACAGGLRKTASLLARPRISPRRASKAGAPGSSGRAAMRARSASHAGRLAERPAGFALAGASADATVDEADAAGDAGVDADTGTSRSQAARAVDRGNAPRKARRSCRMEEKVARKAGKGTPGRTARPSEGQAAPAPRLRPHDRSSTRPLRSRFFAPSSLSRREPSLLGTPARPRGAARLAGRTSACRTRAASFSRASQVARLVPRLLGDHEEHALAVDACPAIWRSRSRVPSSRTAVRPRSNRSSTLEATLFTFCPPGPEARRPMPSAARRLAT